MGASRLKQELIRQNPGAGDSAGFNHFLAVLFPAEQLRIYPYNRYIRDLNGMSHTSFMEKLKKTFQVTESDGGDPAEKGCFGMYLGGKWYMLRLQNEPEHGEGDPVSRLDLSLFQREILEPILGIENQKIDKRIEFFGGEGSTRKLQNRVDRDGGVAFMLYPVSVEELLDVADANLIMPPKSTWFAPKLRSGLLIHTF
jgi:uncharacterized protein (DUF1015 family)